MEEYCRTFNTVDIERMKKLIYKVEKIFNIDIIETLKNSSIIIDSKHEASWDANIISPVFFGYNFDSIKTNIIGGGKNPFESNIKLIKAYLYFLSIFILINFPELMGNGNRINWNRLFSNITLFIDSIINDRCNEFENATMAYVGKTLVELKVMTIKAFVGDENAKNFLKLLYLFGNAISKNALEIVIPIDNIFTLVAKNILSISKNPTMNKIQVQTDILPRIRNTERQHYDKTFSLDTENEISTLLIDTFGIRAPERIVIDRSYNSERGDELVGGKNYTHKRSRRYKPRKKSVKHRHK